jgi:hypothetical protein
VHCRANDTTVAVGDGCPQIVFNGRLSSRDDPSGDHGNDIGTERI